MIENEEVKAKLTFKDVNESKPKRNVENEKVFPKRMGNFN